MKRLTALFMIIALLAAAFGALAEQPSAETAARSVVPENAELLRNGKDDGLMEYHFSTPDGIGWKVEVHPETLEVWKVEIRLNGAVPARTAGALTVDEAKTLALSKVANGRIVEFETDRDDGRREYEGELIAEGVKYDFTIDAETGLLIDWERER
ncbi:MAG: PepSY domain-containing protein [Clostridia bacterium]|nr:PepSY domain-containing protein [Clostridia bacterium]